MALEKTAENLGVEHLSVGLTRSNTSKLWTNLRDGKESCVETAVLGHFICEGWRGYAGEGGLILNLLKIASFPTLRINHRNIYTEALYAQNVAFDGD